MDNSLGGMPSWLQEFMLIFGVAGIFVAKYAFDWDTVGIIFGGAVGGALGGALHYFIFQRGK